MYCRIMKMPKALAANGTINAKNVSSQSSFSMMKYSGI